MAFVWIPLPLLADSPPPLKDLAQLPPQGSSSAPSSSEHMSQHVEVGGDRDSDDAHTLSDSTQVNDFETQVYTEDYDGYLDLDICNYYIASQWMRLSFAILQRNERRRRWAQFAAGKRNQARIENAQVAASRSQVAAVSF